MNKCNEEFLKRNGINPQEISSVVDDHIHSQNEINSIVYDYGFQEERGRKEVSIADIVGSNHNRGYNKKIFDIFDDFFDNNGDGYHVRSIEMLRYSADNVLEGLRRSFEQEPINVKETGEENYIILSNGLHRFTVLRTFYLKELADAKGDEKKIRELKQKYTVPVEVTGINLEKTYCKYILTQIDFFAEGEPKIKYIDSEYDENYKITGNVEFVNNLGEKRIITHEEFKRMTIEKLRQVLESDRVPFYITRAMKYQSFKDFVANNIPNVVELIEEQEREDK